MTVATTKKRPLEVWKFGGASLADVVAIERAVELIRRNKGPLVIVASALGGVTDLLLEGAAAATSGRTAEAARAAAAFLRRHRDVARGLIPAGPARRRLLATIVEAARERSARLARRADGGADGRRGAQPGAPASRVCRRG